ncbi:IclR family transcriptional regulator [Nocardia africana]|uniref:Negative regulator of allantoin and glyoxylate utilization operons n=1 Tax=Nocardia africana TaxID=134964 RepID=A0A378WZ67_9NOCA|nr:IclR family transcriptional regulator [Nocardia africana]MCC3312970.1 IclR family transcriptional regulator [Nocardia africana]SUA45691.1 Negative regulator of allantoin and glyoxylate utilization operons [Nocardia africana]
MRDRPTYPQSSVDNALLLIAILRDQGELTVKDAAAVLGISSSTAHRLLSMLVYRDFAVQDATRRYLPGPALFLGAVEHRATSRLNLLTRPLMRKLRDETRETVHLVVRSGRWVRFIGSVESQQALRVGDRRGAIMPARTASTGKALLADLTTAQLTRLYTRRGHIPADDREAHLTDQEWATLQRALESARRLGYAVNADDTEKGLTAIGVALRTSNGQPIAGLSVAAPTIRMNRRLADRIGRRLVAVATESQQVLEQFQ